MPRRLRWFLGPGYGGDLHLWEGEPRAVFWTTPQGTWGQEGRRVEPWEDIFAALERALTRWGGLALGFLAYEMGALLDPLIPAHSPPLPLAYWAVLGGDNVLSQPGAWRRRGELVCSLPSEAFCQGVEAIQRAIGEGKVYQVNLARRWEVGWEGDPAGLFFHLSPGSWPRFSFFLHDRELGFALLCHSPELFLRRRGQELESWPIKGTWPKNFAGEPGEKEQGELAMIVDLVRNDLGKVCQTGSVEVAVPQRFVATRDVLHTEAVVRGRLLPQPLGFKGVVSAAFPGGSVTGAPKLAACRQIFQLEPVPRGAAFGACGVLSSRGDFTLALPIRTGYVVGRRLFFHAGAGIVWDSDPQREEAETRAKVASWLAALEVGSCPAGSW